MSVDSPTRRHPTPPPPPPKRGGVNVLTLVIAAVSSVVAAILVGKIWASGTLWATAMTPVIVALVKEALERPAQRVREVSVVGRRQSGEDLVVEEVEPPTAAGAPPEPAGYRTYGIRRKHWKVAIVTGLLAFVLGALVLTVPELVAGRSITNGGRATTLFHGKARVARHKEKQQTETTTTTETVTTTTPGATETTPGATETTPTTPTETTTTPGATETTPSGGQTVPPAATAPGGETPPPAGTTTPGG